MRCFRSLTRALQKVMVRSASVLALAASLHPAVSSAQPQKPPPQEPGKQTIKVLQYNTRGMLRDQGPPGAENVDHDQLRFLDVLAERIAAELPDVVALNEICQSQLDHLARILEGRYPMHVEFIHSTEERGGADRRGCPQRAGGGSQWMGLGILTAGPAQPIEAPTVREKSPPGCVLWQGVRVCAVHIFGEEVPVLAGAWGAWAQQAPTIVAGDLNAEPRDPPMNLLFEQFWEADLDNDATAGNRKIDYIFGDKTHFTKQSQELGRVEDTAGACDGKACSDHRMLWGELVLREPLSSEVHCGEVRETIPIVGTGKTWSADWEVTVVQGSIACDEAMQVVTRYVERREKAKDRARWGAVPRTVSGWSCVDLGGKSILGCRKGETGATPDPPRPDQPVIGALSCVESAKPCSKRMILKMGHCGGFGCLDSLP